MDFDKWEHNSFEIAREHSCKIIRAIIVTYFILTFEYVGKNK